MGSTSPVVIRPSEDVSPPPLSVTKRLFDILAAAMGLACVFPILIAIAILIKVDSPGPVIFRQERVGVRFRRFWIYKFRTMVSDATGRGGAITFGDDPRITRVGRSLRKWKLDELPQLLNVLKGEMSVVGPRPEVPQYVDLFRNDYEEILQVRPGLTDPASLRFRDEASLLRNASDAHETYVTQILPEKVRLSKEYVRRSSLHADVRLIVDTLTALSDRSTR